MSALTDTQSAREAIEAAIRSTNSTSGGWKADEKAREALAFLVAKCEELERVAGTAHDPTCIDAFKYGDEQKERAEAAEAALEEARKAAADIRDNWFSLKDERDRLRAALEFYATGADHYADEDDAHWRVDESDRCVNGHEGSHVYRDCDEGRHARSVLAALSNPTATTPGGNDV